MNWDSKTHPLVTTALMLNSSSDVVYEALEARGRYILAGRRYRFLNNDEAVERSLAGRNDRLINLGLARNVATFSVLADLYHSARRGTGDDEYDKAMRLACLSNQVAIGMNFTFDELPGIDSDEFRRLALEGDEDEVATLMSNPRARSVLRYVYGRKPPIDDRPVDCRKERHRD